MTGATSISSNTLRNAKRKGKPMARLASSETAPVLSDKQDQERYFHIPDRKDCEDADITPDDDYFDQALNNHEHLYFDPVLRNYEPTRADFFSIEPWDKDRLKHLTPHYMRAFLKPVGNNPEVPSAPPVLATPTNDKALYHNLIRILRTRIFSRPTLAALLDYHLLFPDLHSVESYNLLISLSIHHRAYGITNRLFRTMKGRSIEYNTETHRLYIRSFIFKGYWDRAWSYAMQLKNKFPGGAIPFPIWLEFCHARSKGPIIGSTYNPKTKKQLIRSEPVSIMSARSNVINSNKPPTIPVLKDTPPAAIRNIVHLMVKSGLKRQALKLTEDYFRALPREFYSRMNDKYLDIVKLHLVTNRIGKTALVRFTATKKLYFSLLSLHPSLRPNSDTLMFILSILKRALRSGTVAWKFISFCKEKWGPEVENSLIRRRVSSWALKEGRMDIVATILRAEAIESTARRPYLAELELRGDSSRQKNAFLDRPTVRRIYPRIGTELFNWHRLRARIRQRIIKLKARGRNVTMRPIRQERRFSTRQEPRFTKRKAQVPQFAKRKAQGPQLTKRKARGLQRTKPKAQVPQLTKRKAQNPQSTNRKVQDPQSTQRKAQDPQPTQRKAQDPQFTKPKAQNPQFTKPKPRVFLFDPKFIKSNAQNLQFTKPKV